MNTLVSQLAQFHFLRPLWLSLIIPALLIAIFLWRRKGSGENWRAAIAPQLLQHLLESTPEFRPQWPWLLLAGWLLAIFALAGPTWEKLPQPVMQKRDGLVIVLDLSLSMYAEDIKPSRIERTRFKIIDILKQRREGLTGLVVYSGDAHIVSPLTDDTATIENLIPALSPAMMPSYGSDVVAGIDNALELLHNSGFERGRILLLSDEIAEDDINKIAQRIDGNRIQFSIIGVGSEQGAPISLPNETRMSGFLRNSDGSIAIAKLHRDRFLQLARKTHALYDDMRVDDGDISRTLPTAIATGDDVRSVEREFDQWRERGPQIVMLLLPLAALAFRRGWLLLIFLIPFSPHSQAFEWQDLWSRPDQQAQRAFDAGDNKSAAEKFNDANWRAAAQYRAGDFNAATESLQTIDTANAHYNRGNALARAGKLKEAIDAYAAALKKNPDDADAKANRELVEKLLKNQKDQQQSSQQTQNQKQSQNDSKNDSASANQSPSNAGQSNSSSHNNNPNNSDQSSAQSNQQAQQDKRDNSSDSKAQDTKQQSSSEKNSQQNNDTNTRAQSSGEKAQQSQASSEKQSAQNAAASAQSADSIQQQRADEKQSGAAESKALSPEQKMQQRATEQWLRQIPDDPSGLLQRKFLYENRQRNQQSQDDGKPLW